MTHKAVYGTLTSQSRFNQKNTMKTEWIQKLKVLAEERYERGYGWQVYIECYAQEDWERLIDGCRTYSDARKKATLIARVLTEQYEEAQP